jgi:putative ABC transport system ATP-binding protein
MLEARNVTLTYVEGGVATNAVDGADFSIDPGEFIGVIGPSGSGKSSLLYLLAGLKTPTSGAIRFRDVEISSISRDARAEIRQRHFGLIFQQHFLIQYLTAVENVMVALPKPTRADRDAATDLLIRVGMEPHLNKFPHQLSGGQRQRVAAIRSLMHRPDIVFADEPTASLDHTTGSTLMDIVEERRREQGSALVVVTHDPSILTGADRVLSMWDGVLSEDTPERDIPTPEPGSPPVLRQITIRRR